MRKEIADKLVTALRSGEYSQTTGRLRDANGFCCLGVLCDIAVKEGVVPTWTEDLDPDGVQRYGIMYPTALHTATLPPVVKEWAGMQSDNGSYNRDEEGYYTEALSSDNDGGASFGKIANFIEERYMEL
jgi:hypothetical protein